ncbi:MULTISPECIES: PIN domain-containing protein [Nocardia]|uniref:PIN domain-containing protein n=1 Tax=Nocardia TaxID=1817 RepID=UPI0019169EF3|nr:MULTISPECIES: PIN domain-containing protein [Nocardia]
MSVMVSGRGTNVLVDANVLFSRTLRDWLALLYLHPGNEMFEVMWTDDIMVEFHYHLRKKNPLLDDAQVGGVRRTLENTFEKGRITDYTIDRTIAYPDVDDAHVHCAAVYADVDILLTDNVEHFTRMDDLPYEIYSADDFFELIDDSAPQIVRAVTAEQLVYYVRRSDTSSVSLPERLKAAGAPAFAERVRQHLQTLDINALLREPT